jgi:hypothetical protein
VSITSNYVDEVAPSTATTTTISEEYKPYTEIPFSFDKALSEKKFNNEWEEYLKKNPNILKPVFILIVVLKSNRSIYRALE